MNTIPFEDAEHQLGKLVDEAEHGKPVVIEKGGRLFKLVEITRGESSALNRRFSDLAGLRLTSKGVLVRKGTSALVYRAGGTVKQFGNGGAEVVVSLNGRPDNLFTTPKHNAATTPVGTQASGQGGAVTSGTTRKRRIGQMKRKITMAPDFGDPDDMVKLFEGNN